MQDKLSLSLGNDTNSDTASTASTDDSDDDGGKKKKKNNNNRLDMGDIDVEIKDGSKNNYGVRPDDNDRYAILYICTSRIYSYIIYIYICTSRI